MPFKRKSESVYIGYNEKEFSNIRDFLDAEGIDYEYKVRNHQNQFLMPGEGTIRGKFGSLGVDLEKASEYEIKVCSKDVERANYIIRKQREKSR